MTTDLIPRDIRTTIESLRTLRDAAKTTEESTHIRRAIQDVLEAARTRAGLDIDDFWFQLDGDDLADYLYPTADSTFPDPTQAAPESGQEVPRDPYIVILTDNTGEKFDVMDIRLGGEERHKELNDETQDATDGNLWWLWEGDYNNLFPNGPQGSPEAVTKTPKGDDRASGWFRV